MDRVYGADRYATSLAVAMKETDPDGKIAFLGLATGRNFPDALGGGAACGKNRGILLLTPPDGLPPASGDWLRSKHATSTTAKLFGGSNVLSDNVMSDVKAALQ